MPVGDESAACDMVGITGATYDPAGGDRVTGI